MGSGIGTTRKTPRSGWRATLIFPLLGACSFSQHLPLMFLSVAVPAMLRQSGMPIEQVSMVGLAFLPFAFQVLWAPLLDRYQLSSWGRWRGWILLTQVLGAIVLATLAEFPPDTSFAIFMVLAMMLSLVAGTQKIAQAAYGVESVTGDLRAWVNVAQGCGAALGTLAGTVGLLTLYEAAGWRTAMLVSAAILIVVGLILPALSSAPNSENVSRLSKSSFKRAFSNPNFVPMAKRALWLGVPLGMLFGLMQPRLVDSGLGLEKVGLINGLGYVLAWLIAGPIAGAISSRLTIRIGYAISALTIFCLCLFNAGAAYAGPGDQLLAASSAVAAYAAICFGAVRLYTSFMFATRPDHAATDINALICFFSLVTIMTAGLSGSIAASTGYAGAYVLAALWVLVGLIMTAASPTSEGGENSSFGTQR